MVDTTRTPATACRASAFSELFSAGNLDPVEHILCFLPLEDVDLHVRCTNRMCRDIAHDCLRKALPFILPLFNAPYWISRSGISLSGVFFTTELRMYGTQFTVANSFALATAVDNGALPRLKLLDLGDNEMGNVGLSALAEAVGNGALPALTYLALDQNKIGDKGLQSLASAVGSGALPALEKLFLNFNQIGDLGVIELSKRISNGALPALQTINLSRNNIGDAGFFAFAAALCTGALPAVEKTIVWENPGSVKGVHDALISRGSQCREPCAEH